jgi:hypothetical protein
MFVRYILTQVVQFQLRCPNFFDPELLLYRLGGVANKRLALAQALRTDGRTVPKLGYNNNSGSKKLGQRSESISYPKHLLNL